jgi:predicted metal-dependent enzyme (double-stranded beta helix superfamily)
VQYSALPAPLRQFVDDVEARLETECDERDLLAKVGESLGRLVAKDDWLAPAYAEPHPEHYRQYLLYADPGDRFSVVSFVWGPSQQTPIHDHTVWGVIGVLRGAELTQRYTIAPDGTPTAAGRETRLMQGAVEFVSPTVGDVHKVRNALHDRASVSIHAYGANIGKVRRHVFPPEGGAPKEFVSGYDNAESPAGRKPIE